MATADPTNSQLTANHNILSLHQSENIVENKVIFSEMYFLRITGKTVSQDFLLQFFFMNHHSIPKARHHRYQRHGQQILPQLQLVLLIQVASCHRYQRHGQQILPQLQLVVLIQVASCHRYQRHRRQICHQCERHRWQIIGTISGCRHLKVNLKAKINIYVNSTTQRCPNKTITIFLIKDFSICRRCQRHRWCTLSFEYLREFRKYLKRP